MSIEFLSKADKTDNSITTIIMKINSFKMILAFFASCLLIYFLWSFCRDNEETSLKVLLCFSGFTSFIITLVGATALQYNDGKHAVNAKIVSWLFFVTFLIEHALLALIGISQSFTIIATGLFLVIYISIVHAISKTSM